MDEPSETYCAEAQPFETMAQKIALNVANGFGGACVLVAPEGVKIELLFLDPDADLAIFFSTIKSKIDQVLLELEEKQKGATAWRR